MEISPPSVGPAQTQATRPSASDAGGWFDFQGSRRGRLVGALLIIAASVAIYWPAVHGSWLWDDDTEITRNPLLRHHSSLAPIWRGEESLDYFPLKTTVQWVFWHLWGDAPEGWHLASLALHVAAALLLWRIFWRLGLRFAWFGAILFAVHPVAVESVAWMAELKNPLSLAIVLLAFDAYLDFDARQRPHDLWRGIVLFIAALLCKTSVIALPCALLLFVWWRHGRIDARRAWSLAPFFAAALALGLVTIRFQAQRAIADVPVPAGGLALRFVRAGEALAFYAGKTLWPLDVMPVYPRWTVQTGSLAAYLPWVGLAALIGLAWSGRAGWGRHLIFAGGVFALTLAPVLGFVAMAYMHVTWVADHLAYAALPAATGLLAAVIGVVIKRARGAVRGVVMATAALWVGLLAGLSCLHAANFRDAEALWTYAVRQNGEAALPHLNLGNAYYFSGRMTEAAAQYAACVRLDPKDPGAHISLGNALSALGRQADALREHETAVALAPASSAAANSLGGTLLDEGRLDDAEREIRRAIALQPSLAEAHNNLGIVLARRKDFDTAVREFEAALRFDPGLAAARGNLEEARANAAASNK